MITRTCSHEPECDTATVLMRVVPNRSSHASDASRLLNPPRPPKQDGRKTERRGAGRVHDGISAKPMGADAAIPYDMEDAIDTEELPACDKTKTDELPVVRIVHMPPRFVPREMYVRNGDAARFLEERPVITVGHYDPRDSVMTVDDDGNANTHRIGTRIIPLDEVAKDGRYPCGALGLMVRNRREGRIASAIGHDYIMESDELTQGEITVYAKAF